MVTGEAKHIMHIRTERLTYDDYLTLPNDGKRYELIEGELIVTPSPSTEHQIISGRLYKILTAYNEERKVGKVLYAPLDVVFSMTDVVQPDIIFISNENSGIITKRNIIGPPDLVIEILSESTESSDRTLKKKLYERFGVREYWIVDPDTKSLDQFVLKENSYLPATRFEKGDSMEVHVMSGFTITLSDVFE